MSACASASSMGQRLATGAREPEDVACFAAPPSPGGFGYFAGAGDGGDDDDEIAYAPLGGAADHRDCRDRSPDGVESFPDAYPKARKALRRSDSAPAWTEDGGGGGDRSASSENAALNDALARAKGRAAAPKLRKSVSFHATVTLVRSESLTHLPADEKARVWYRNADYSTMVTAELARRRTMGVTSTSLIMPSTVAHCEPDAPASDDDVAMDHWTLRGCGSSSDDDADDGGDGGGAPFSAAAADDDGDAPIQICG